VFANVAASMAGLERILRILALKMAVPASKAGACNAFREFARLHVRSVSGTRRGGDAPYVSKWWGVVYVSTTEQGSDSKIYCRA
jgi:hypothetical protein